MKYVHQICSYFLISFFSLSSFLFSNENITLTFNEISSNECIIQKNDNSPEKISSSFLDENIKWMNESPSNASGMNIIIICANTPSLVSFWENRLKKTQPYLLPPEAIVICVEEEWAKGGAGNGLGTLYAYQNARIKAQKDLGIDILEKQMAGAAVAMYHTAGMGKRLAPLTVSKFGIKSAVELPGLIHPPSSKEEEILLFTLLEATIKQSMIYGSSRKGRLSVFWSDQVFIPSDSVPYKPESHIDILVKTIPIPSDQSWNEQNLQNYGLVTWNSSGEAMLFDKCDHQTFQGICDSNNAISKKELAISMGTFSVSSQLLLALINEFKEELKNKTALLDSDPYFWMPMTLDFEMYSIAMKARDVPSEFILKHYQRMQRFKNAFLEKENSLPLFFAGIDIGTQSYWWDYGTVDAYFKNNMKMTQAGKEGDLMRQFYHLNSIQSVNGDQHSFIIGCDIKKGTFKNSIAIGVKGDNISLENCMMIGGKVKTFQAVGSLVYHVHENQQTTLPPNSVRADLMNHSTSQHIKLTAPINSDGKKNWKTKLPNNSYSWEEAVELVSEMVDEKGPHYNPRN